MDSSHRAISASNRSRDPPSRPTLPHTSAADRGHRDRPAASTPPHNHSTKDPDHEVDAISPASKPAGKLGSYQMRQGLQFNMETPKFLQQLKAQVGGNTSTRFTGSQTDADSPAKRQRRAIQGESELDDDGPLIVMPDDAGGDMDPRDLERLKVMHPNAVVDGLDDANGRESTQQKEADSKQSRTGPSVDPKTGKLLFQAKTNGGAASASEKRGAVSVGKKVATNKGDKASDKTGSSAKKAGRQKKGESHLLSFDE